MRSKKPNKKPNDPSVNHELPADQESSKDAFHVSAAWEDAKQKAYEDLEINLAKTTDVYEKLKLIEAFDKKYFKKSEPDPLDIGTSKKINDALYPKDVAGIYNRINKLYDDYEIAIAEIKLSTSFGDDDKQKMYVELENILRQLEVAAQDKKQTKPNNNTNHKRKQKDPSTTDKATTQHNDRAHFDNKNSNHKVQLTSPIASAIVNIHKLNQRLIAILVALKRKTAVHTQVIATVEDLPPNLNNLLDEVEDIESALTAIIAPINSQHLDQDLNKLMREFVLHFAREEHIEKIATIKETEEIQRYLLNKMLILHLNLVAEVKLNILFDPRYFIMQRPKPERVTILRDQLHRLFDEHTDFFIYHRYRYPTLPPKGFISRLKRFKMNRFIAKEFWLYSLATKHSKSRGPSTRLASRV